MLLYRGRTGDLYGSPRYDAAMDSTPLKDRFADTWLGAYADAGEEPTTPAPLDLSAQPSGDRGPCLYLGPAGQRCDRPALEDGFCSVHQPGGPAGKIGPSNRTLAAIAAIAGILWPYIADVVRLIVRWLHSH